MKTTFLAFSFWLLAIPCFAQGVRVGDSLPLQTTAVIQGTTVLTPISSGAIQFCNAPANAVPCTNKATTYTDRTLGTPCSVSVQVVLAGTTTCVANSDANGNWGVWVASANYEWTFTNSAGASFGPFPVTANSSPNTNVWSALAAPLADLTISHATNRTSFSWGTITPAYFGSYSGPLNLTSTFATTFPTVFFTKGGNWNIGGLAGNGAGLSSGALTFEVGTTPAIPVGNVVNFDPTILPSVGVRKNNHLNTAGLVAGIVVETDSNTNALVAYFGFAACNFDNAAILNDWVVVSSTIDGDCHDSGSQTPPATSVTTIGRVAVPALSLVQLQLSR